MKKKLKDIYKTLIGPESGSQRDFYLSEKIDHNTEIYVGISPNNEPTLLIHSIEEDYRLQKSIQDFTGVSIEFYKECFIKDEETSSRNFYNVIIYKKDDPSLRNFFFDFFEDFFVANSEINGQILVQEINNLIELFSLRRKASRQKMMGLWSELFILKCSYNKDLWAEKWHDGERSTFDFRFPSIGVDVKSFSGNKREHFFKLEQLSNDSVREQLILSICLTENDTGQNVFELFEDIKKDIVSKKLIKKIQKQVFKNSGDKADDLKRYDESIARETLCLINSKDIPRIKETPPIGVTEIKFKSDCSNAKNVPFNDDIQLSIENDKYNNK